MAPRENENNAYAKFWGDKQRALWYVMAFSGVVNYKIQFFMRAALIPVPLLCCTFLKNFATTSR